MKIRCGFVSNSSTSSFVVIGFVLDKEKYSKLEIMKSIDPENNIVAEALAELKKPNKERCCSHPLQANADFCSRCGKPMYEEVDREELANDIINGSTEFDEFLDEIGMIFKDNSDDGAPDHKCIIGIELADVSGDDSGIDESEIDLEEITEKLNNIKKKLSLNRTEPIKIISGTQCS